MIHPNKFTDLENSLVTVSSRILAFLKNRTKISYDELGTQFSSSISIESDEYKYAIDLLFCLGLLDYDDEKDEVYLII